MNKFEERIMKNPIKIILEEEPSQQTQRIKAWEYQRTKGKWHFVFKIGLLWSFSMSAVLTLFDYLTDGGIKLEILRFRLLFFVGFGFVSALILWQIGERKYQKHLKDNS